MKKVPLSKGYVAVVDDDDFDWVSQWKWTAQETVKPGKVYAVRYTKGGRLHRRRVRMHRELIGVNDPNLEVDHRDNNGLNNTRENLRVATKSQNQQNREKTPGCSSRFKGVRLHRYNTNRPWGAYIRAAGKLKLLGYFSIEEEAAAAYNSAAASLFGDFASLNQL